MKKLILIVLFLTSIVTNCFSQNKTDQLRDEGLYLFEKGDIQGALIKFEEIIKISGQNADAHLRKADCLDLLNKIEESIRSYSRAIEIEPKNKIALYNRALSYEKEFDFKNTINDYKQAISIDPNNTIEPNNKIIYNNLGILYGQLEQLEKAIEAFSSAIKIDELYADAYYNRGYAYQLQGKEDEAIKDFDKTLKLDPTTEVNQKIISDND